MHGLFTYHILFRRSPSERTFDDSLGLQGQRSHAPQHTFAVALYDECTSLRHLLHETCSLTLTMTPRVAAHSGRLSSLQDAIRFNEDITLASAPSRGYIYFY